MAIKKIRMRPEGTNDYADVLHPETSAEQVIMNSGETLEDTIDTHLAESVTQAHMPQNVGLGNVDNVKQASKTEFDVHNNDATRHMTSVERTKWNAVDNKVDKVTGKGLSTNDYTAAEKTKLSGIESGANKTTIDNTLTSTSTTQALSATQGKVLDDKISNLSESLSGLEYSELSSTATNIDSEGIYQNIEWRRKDNTIYAKSTLLGTTPNYNQIKVDYYNELGTTIIKSITWDIEYDINDFSYKKEVVI